jgi:acrylyl-CoA reductase (NADPH)
MQTGESTFRAILTIKKPDNTIIREIRNRTTNDLPHDELLVKVHYSSLNFKDALSATGHPGVTRRYPHTPGIDAAGEVVDCIDNRLAPGDKVIITGHDLGMNTDGGWGQYIRVPATWAIPLPTGLTLWESMALGTAGLTAALSVLKLKKAGLKPADGDIVVTGSTGGVGSLAVSILAKEGYRVTAVTGKTEQTDYLMSLGATSVVGRDQIAVTPERALFAERWAGAVDVVGGSVLASLLKSMKYGGIVACCGLAGSPDLIINVYPFILRGVSLLGVDSAECPDELRVEAWHMLANDWKPHNLFQIARTCNLEGLEEKIHMILAGRLSGRVVVDLFTS